MECWTQEVHDHNWVKVVSGREKWEVWEDHLVSSSGLSSAVEWSMSTSRDGPPHAMDMTALISAVMSSQKQLSLLQWWPLLRVSQNFPGPLSWLQPLSVTPLIKFSGDEKGGDGDAFPDSLEQFEMVANLAGCNNNAKLTNQLKGPACSFYRSCTPEQWANCILLLQELSKQFIPVYIDKLDSSTDDARRGESVDSTPRITGDFIRVPVPRHSGEIQQLKLWGHLYLLTYCLWITASFWNLMQLSPLTTT